MLSNSDMTLLFLILFGGVQADVSPPCAFNPLCTCSRSDAHLGVVACVDIPLRKLPMHLNLSKISSLELNNNELKSLEPNLLSGTGLHMLKIRKNPLHQCHEDLFKGLENSLRNLELSYINLIEIPRKALRHLQKLQILNLSGNDITDVGSDNWGSIRNTVETLILKQNSIQHVPANAFEKFTRLKVLDLSSNVLYDIDPDAFFPDTVRLIHLHLADNLLRYVPYALLQYLRSLKTLDLGYNSIAKVSAVSESTRIQIDTKFSLNSLNLEYNNIKSLSSEDFQKFDIINKTYFNGNPISSVQVDTFRNVRIFELSLSGCGLMEFNVKMLSGLEETLAVLDLSNNNLRKLDSNIFQRFLKLQELKFLGNKIEIFSVPDFNGNILRMQVGGGPLTNQQTLFRDVSKIKSLIALSVSNVEVTYMAPEFFMGYGFGVEELSITHANMKSIYPQAFIHVRGIKKLDLSNNELADVHVNAFVEIGHSLNYLYLSHAFAKTVNVFPHTPVKHLNSLRLLDISYNNFEELPVDTFHTMYNLEIIRVHDCRINVLKRETFQSDIHDRLKEVIFSFNRIEVIKSYTFNELVELTYLNFEDNIVKTIETKAFNNLKNLKWIYLRGNRIEVIESDAFANLPELEVLDLAFNNLKSFDFATIDAMVGSLTFLSLNLSFNFMHQFPIYFMDPEPEILELNVKVLDLSHNNITQISYDFFAPFENSLTHLYFSHNRLTNISHDIFGSLYELQWLDFSHNHIEFIEHDTFKETHKIQIMNFSTNHLQDVPYNLFHGVKNLRIVDLSNNELNFLPEFLFREDSLESISCSKNYFNRIPFKLFIPEVAASLREFDLSFNAIDMIHTREFMSLFKSLLVLNLSGNKLSRLENPLFSSLHNLLYLDLSHNKDLQLTESSQIFYGLETLRYLGLKNTSLTVIPSLNLRQLMYLYLSNNNLSTIMPEAATNLTSMRVLDLSCNKFASIPVVILSMKSLKLLNLSRNSISVLSNNSLLSGFEELRELDITELPLLTFETGTLNRLSSLRTLHISTFVHVGSFNIPKILERNHALQNLHIDVQVKELRQEMQGYFPRNLRSISLHGEELEILDSKILMGVTFSELHLSVRDTRIEYIGDDLFRNIPAVRNISVDVRNNWLRSMANPSTETALNLYGHSFLMNLKISHNLWSCKCDIGWIETWKRVKRQIFCHHLEMFKSKAYHNCMKTEDDLRITRCANRELLMLVMQNELECGFSHGFYNFKVDSAFVLLILSSWFVKFIFSFE